MAYELSEFSPGELLVFSDFPLNHWAVYAGKDIVIHYTKTFCPFEILVREESIQTYWSREERRRYPKHEPSLGKFDVFSTVYSPDEIVERAREYIGEGDYDLFWNNCESFAKWCKYGVKMSEQAQRFGIAVLTVSSTPEAAASGAVIGVAVGSAFFPGVGTVIGGAIGLGVGAAAGVLTGVVGGWGLNQVMRKVKSNKQKYKK